MEAFLSVNVLVPILNLLSTEQIAVDLILKLELSNLYRVLYAVDGQIGQNGQPAVKLAAQEELHLDHVTVQTPPHLTEVSHVLVFLVKQRVAKLRHALLMEAGAAGENGPCARLPVVLRDIWSDVETVTTLNLPTTVLPARVLESLPNLALLHLAQLTVNGEPGALGLQSQSHAVLQLQSTE